MLGAPAVIVYTSIVLIPIGISAGISLTNLNTRFHDTSFVGLNNYFQLFKDHALQEAFLNTIIITAIVVAIPTLAGLAIALLLDRATKPFRIMQSIVFIPVTLSAVVISFVWSTFLTDGGLINSTLRQLHLEGLTQSWLGKPGIALVSIALVVSWQMTGFCTIVFLAGLKGVPSELIEAATIDGASRVQRFAFVTWRFLAPALTINVVMLLITGLRTFDYVIVLTNGGPAGSTETVATTIVKLAFQNTRTAYSSALAMILLIVIATLCALTLRILQSREIEA